MPDILVPVAGDEALLAELSVNFPLHGFGSLTTAQKTVGTKIPTASPKPADFVRVLAVGGAGRDLVTDSQTLVLEGWSSNEGRAQRICALGVAFVQAAARLGMLGGYVCYGATATVPANLPDSTVPDRFRFTSTISADLRRAAV